MAVALRCPRCRQRFHWNVDEGWPRNCLVCKADISQNGQDDDNVIAMPAFLTNTSKSADQVARQVMDGGHQRAEMAAAMAGGTAADYSSLEITNLSDRKDSPTNMAPVNNPVSQFMQANPQAPIGFNGDGAQYSTQVQSGPGANAGAKMMTKLRAHHDTISHGSAVSERPALETQQPGYRRRG